MNEGVTSNAGSPAVADAARARSDVHRIEVVGVEHDEGLSARPGLRGEHRVGGAERLPAGPGSRGVRRRALRAIVTSRTASCIRPDDERDAVIPASASESST